MLAVQFTLIKPDGYDCSCQEEHTCKRNKMLTIMFIYMNCTLLRKAFIECVIRAIAPPLPLVYENPLYINIYTYM